MSPPARVRALFVLFLLVTAAPAGAAPGKAPASERLHQVERALEQGRKDRARLEGRARELAREVGRLQRDSVTLARAIQDQEGEVLRLEDRLAELAHREAAIGAGLERRRGQLTGVLIGLERLARNPPEALIAQPLSPADSVRSAILLRAVVPEIERRATVLRDDLGNLLHARREIARRRDQLSTATKKLKVERVRLARLMAEKKALKHRTEGDKKALQDRVRKLAREAQDLRGLLARIERERRRREAERASRQAPAAPAGRRSIRQARGTLSLPAVGRVIGFYGQATDTGMTRKGILIEARPGGQVIAPYGGRVVFAGAFRGYGQLLIIEHGEGYHTLLAGLDRIDSVTGQTVLRGEPVGVMGRRDTSNPTLYVELRRNGQPVNPLPWLAARKGKVSG